MKIIDWSEDSVKKMNQNGLIIGVLSFIEAFWYYFAVQKNIWLLIMTILFSVSLILPMKPGNLKDNLIKIILSIILLIVVIILI